MQFSNFEIFQFWKPEPAICMKLKVKVKVKQFLYKPITEPGGSRSLGLPYFKTMDKQAGKFVIPTQLSPFPSKEIFLLLIFVNG
jgi:hypothetical protein